MRGCLESPRRGWILANMTHTGTGRIKHFPTESVRAPTSLSRGHIAPADTALTKLLRLVVWRERLRLVLPRKALCSVDLRAWGYSACYSRGALDLSSSLGLPPARQSCLTRRFRYLRRTRLICREVALHPCRALLYGRLHISAKGISLRISFVGDTQVQATCTQFKCGEI